MSWMLNDLTLSDATVPEAADGGKSLRLTIHCTPALRRQLQELCEHAGRVERIELHDGTEVVLDPTGGQNTVYLTSDAPTHVESGWYAVESIDDTFIGSSKARVTLDLARICGPHNAHGTTKATTLFEEHDF